MAKPVIVVAPSKGKLETWGSGWIYTPKSTVTTSDTDTFSYKLVLNSEESLKANVDITFI